MAARSALKFYFSLRSPYSWLAYHDLQTIHPGLGERLEWIPFWEPDELSLRLLAQAGGDFVYTAMSRAKHLYVLQDVRRLARERNLTVTWPVDRSPWWEVPHLAYLVARRRGRGPQFIAAASAARWRDGRDICDPEVIAALAADIGLDPGELRGAVDDPDVRSEGVAALLSIHRDGVFGVPFFVRGYDKFWGVDRLPIFAAAVRAADVPVPTGLPVAVPATVPRQLLAELPKVDLASTDGGHAGGCG
jgi:2-hydroxychromene-2-carboxylate isomerase